LTRRCDEALNADPALPQLEQTIIQSATNRFEAVMSYFEKIKDGTADQDDGEQFNRDYAALSAVLELGSLRDGGMSLAGRAILRRTAGAVERSSQPLGQAHPFVIHDQFQEVQGH
ncbi:MAG: hypothetical protein ACKVIS_23780, partial [Pseudomonadales bacterium]